MGTIANQTPAADPADRAPARTALQIAAALAAASLVASCASAPAPGKRHGKEYFSESAYGVKASPRVVEYGQPVPQGGGRYMVGQPYTVKGRVYRPIEDASYTAVGYASWYGSAFHGRRTANGEVYDMDSLSAASPILPLPSYARVTNLQNGRSVVVRVNDRGPYERDRVVDLSSYTADILDLKGHGTAKVKVSYVGPAKMEGGDKQMLLATYRGPKNFGDTMFAMKAPSSRPSTAIAMAKPAPARSWFNFGFGRAKEQPAPQPVVTTVAARAPLPAPQPAYVAPAAPQPEVDYTMASAAPAPRQRPDANAYAGSMDPYNGYEQAASSRSYAPAPRYPTQQATYAPAPRYDERQAPAVAEPQVEQANVASPGLGAPPRSLGTIILKKRPNGYGADGGYDDGSATYEPISARSSYANDEAVAPAQAAINNFARPAASNAPLQAALEQKIRRAADERSANLPDVQVGVFSDGANADAIAARLSPLGVVRQADIQVGGKTMRSLRLLVRDASKSSPQIVAEVAAAGAPGAYVISR